MPNKKDIDNARKNRLALIAAGLSRRELFKMGLLTGAGYLVAKKGLSSRAWGFDGGKSGGGGGGFRGVRGANNPPTPLFFFALEISPLTHSTPPLHPTPPQTPPTPPPP